MHHPTLPLFPFPDRLVGQLIQVIHRANDELSTIS